MSVQPSASGPVHPQALSGSDKVNATNVANKKPSKLKKLLLETELISKITSKLQSDHKIQNSKKVASFVDTTLRAVFEHPHYENKSEESEEYPADILEETKTSANLPEQRPLTFNATLHEIVNKNRKHPQRILEKLKPVILGQLALDPMHAPNLHKFEKCLDEEHLKIIANDIKYDEHKDEYGRFFVACLDKSCEDTGNLVYFLNTLHEQYGDLEMGLHNLMKENPWASDIKLLEMAGKLNLLPEETARLPNQPKKAHHSPSDMIHEVVLPSFKQIVYARESDKVAHIVSKEFKKLAGETKVEGITVEAHKQIGDFDEIRAKIMEKYKDDPLKAASALKKATLVLLARDPIYHITALDIMKMSIAMDKHLSRVKKYYDAAGKDCHDYQRFSEAFLKNSNTLEQYTEYLQKTTGYEQERMEAKTRFSREIAKTMNDFIPGTGDTASILDIDRWVATLTTDFMERVDMKEFSEDALSVFGKFMGANAKVLEKLTDDLKNGNITKEQFDDPKIYQELVLKELDKMGMKHPAVSFQAGEVSPEEEQFFNALSKAVLNQLLMAYPTATKILDQQIIHDIITPQLIKLINEQTQPFVFYQRIVFVLEKLNNEAASEKNGKTALPVPYQGQELKQMAQNFASFTAAALQAENAAQSKGQASTKRRLLNFTENLAIQNIVPGVLEKRTQELFGEVQQLKGLQLVDMAAEGLKLFREIRRETIGPLSDNPELAKVLEKEALDLISIGVQNLLRAKIGDYISAMDVAKDLATGTFITVPLVAATYGTAGGIRGAGILGGLLAQGAGLASKKTTEAYYMLSNGLNSLWSQSSEAYDETTQKAFLETIDSTARRVAEYIYTKAETAAKKAEATGQPAIDAMARFHEEHADDIKEMIAHEVDLAVRGQMRHLGNQGVLKNLMYQIITDAAVNGFLPDQKEKFRQEWAAAQA